MTALEIEAVAAREVEFLELVRLAAELDIVPDARVAVLVGEAFAVICGIFVDKGVEVVVPLVVIFDETDLSHARSQISQCNK